MAIAQTSKTVKVVETWLKRFGNLMASGEMRSRMFCSSLRNEIMLATSYSLSGTPT